MSFKYEIDTQTPVPTGKTGQGSKYDEILDSLEPGHSLKFDNPEDAIQFTSGLRSRLITRRLHHLKVIQRTNMPDGYSRVFLVKRKIKMADVSGRRIRMLGD